VGQLGDMLEVLFGPDDGFQTIRATIRHWCDDDLARELTGVGRTLWGRKKATREKEPKARRIATSSSTIWLHSPACGRIENRREVNGVIETGLSVTDGDRRWECDAEGHVDTKAGEDIRRASSGANTFDIIADRHFNPGQIRLFLEHLTLQQQGLTRTADRECVSVKAIPRTGAGLWPHWLPHGADEYEFHFDRERAALLNIVGRCQGQAFALHEVTEIAFDESLDPGLFIYEPRPGQQVAPAVPVVEHMSLEAAIARMPFTVLVPTRVPNPEHARADVMYHPPRRQGGWSHLTLSYRGSQAFGRLWVKQDGAPGFLHDDLEWEWIASDGIVQNDLRISDPGEAVGMRIVAFEQHGTYVEITSDLDRTTLIDFARSFTAAPRSTAV
jgi:hypothetical protein